MKRIPLTVAEYWYRSGTIEPIDYAHWFAFPFGYYHEALFQIAFELMAEDTLLG